MRFARHISTPNRRKPAHFLSPRSPYIYRRQKPPPDRLHPTLRKQTARILSTENAGLGNGFAKMLLAGGGRWRSRRLCSRFNFLHVLFGRLFGAGRRRRRSGILRLRSSRSRQHRNRGQQGNAHQFFHFIFSSFVAVYFFSPPTSLLCPESRSSAIASIGDSRLRILMKESS